MQKVWIFGDSYANDSYNKHYAWSKRIAQTYDVKNYAIGGTGPEYMMQLFRDAIQNTETDELEKINLIFFLSGDERKNFNFTMQPEDQSIMMNVIFGRNDDLYIRKRVARYKSYKKFLHNFFRRYYLHNDLQDFRQLQYVGILKEYSVFFKKVLVVNVFDDPQDSLLYKKFGLPIQDTEKFTFCKGPSLYSIEKDINKELPNHLSPTNHDLLVNEMVNWIDHNISPNINNLKKIA
jgi:hypothetical protein